MNCMQIPRDERARRNSCRNLQLSLNNADQDQGLVTCVCVYYRPTACQHSLQLRRALYWV